MVTWNHLPCTWRERGLNREGGRLQCLALHNIIRTWNILNNSIWIGMQFVQVFASFGLEFLYSDYELWVIL